MSKTIFFLVECLVLKALVLFDDVIFVIMKTDLIQHLDSSWARSFSNGMVRNPILLSLSIKD